MNCKLVIYGSNMYKEVIFDDGFQGVLTIGTDKACQIAFRRERFVSGFIVRIDRREDGQYMMPLSECLVTGIKLIRNGNRLSANYFQRIMDIAEASI